LYAPETKTTDATGVEFENEDESGEKRKIPISESRESLLAMQSEGIFDEIKITPLQQNSNIINN